MEVKPPENVIKLAAFLPYQISVLSHHISRLTSALAAEHGLNLSQWRVLAALAEQPGRTAIEVVAITPMDKGIVSRAVKTLLGLNLVMRQASKTDGRLSHLYLTADGNTIYVQLAAKIRLIEQKLTTSIPIEEQQKISQYMQSFTTAVIETECLLSNENIGKK